MKQVYPFSQIYSLDNQFGEPNLEHFQKARNVFPELNILVLTLKVDMRPTQCFGNANLPSNMQDETHWASVSDHFALRKARGSHTRLPERVAQV